MLETLVVVVEAVLGVAVVDVRPVPPGVEAGSSVIAGSMLSNTVVSIVVLVVAVVAGAVPVLGLADS